MSRVWRTRVVFIAIFLSSLPLIAQQPAQQVGYPGRPNYDSFRMDKIAAQGDASFSGDLNLSLPVLVVPGRHGHDFAITLSYNSHLTQSQKASWVGLGWNLDIGAIERTIQGRADDQVDGLVGTDYLGSDPGSGGGPPWRAERVGRMSVSEKNLVDQDRDQSDLYNLIMEGDNTELYYIPDTVTNGQFYSGPYKFLAPQYRTMDVQAWWNAGTGPITGFGVFKDDGTEYDFGQSGQNGCTDKIEVQGKTIGNTTAQNYSFPYRWSLWRIHYPDGATTKITYNRHNQNANAVRRRYESAMFDRSYPWVGNLFAPGLTDGQVYHLYDSLRYWYSSPDSLITDTHYLVFLSSAPSSSDMAARNRRLDAIVLYDRLTQTELKRVVFTYATQPNPNTENYPWNDWQLGTQLANDQLTLIKVSTRTPDDIYTDAVPPYVFTYWKNPRFSEEFNMNYSNQQPQYPGYRCGDFIAADTVFSTAWRLRSVTLPTGARIEYSYQRLSGIQGDPFTVTYDAEGHVAANVPYSYLATPRCRIVQKKVVDTLGVTQVYTYQYGTAIFDSPSRPSSSSYWPAAYASQMNSYPYSMDFYQYYRGCPLGHRWVQVTNPDGSWKKAWYTTSYAGADKFLQESQPDVILAPGGLPNNATILYSNYARRGLVWKEQTNLSSTTNYYSYLNQWEFTEPYRYAFAYDYNYSYKAVLRSIWPRLDSTQTVMDGITHSTLYAYNPTRVNTYGVWKLTDGTWLAGTTINALPSSKTERGSVISRLTIYEYACSRYVGMDSLFMLSQPYSTKVGSLSNDDSRRWTTYGKYSGHWLPRAEWSWNSNFEYGLAPSDTNGTESDGTAIVRTVLNSYDAFGCSDVIAQLDANGNTTNFYFSSDSINPFSNNAAGFARGYVTGIEKIRSGSASPLRTSMVYDGYGNIIKQTNENGNVTRATYDFLGRLTAVFAPNGQKASDFSYAYFANAIPLSPNKIVSNGYRTASDWTASRIFYNCLGLEMQRQVTFGVQDIVSHTSYDQMARPAQPYRAFQLDLGGANRHTYDPSFQAHAQSYNSNSGSYPFNLTTYEQDPGGRPLNQFYSGTIFSNSDLLNNHYTKMAYGINGTELPDFTTGSLHKTKTTDENSWSRTSYTDKLGNAVASVVDSGGLGLTTLTDYDASGRPIRVYMPQSYSPPGTERKSGSLTVTKPQTTGVIDLTSLGSGPKVITVTLFANSDGSGGGFRPMLPQDGILIVYHISQYANGSLLAQTGSLSIQDYPDDHSSSITQQFLPTLLGNADEAKLVIESITYYTSSNSGILTFDCQLSPDISYAYNKRGGVIKRYMAASGTTQYLYDKNGNLRFIKDAAHTGGAPNTLNVSTTIPGGTQTSSNFTLFNRGKVNLTLNASNYPTVGGSVTLTVKAPNGTAMIALVTTGTAQSGSLILPQGTYSYSVVSTAGGPPIPYTVRCQTQYPFVYHKYDVLNRVIETGEYEAATDTADFKKANAENSSYPSTGLLSRAVLYDTVSTDAFAAGQRNLYGKASQVTLYRLGTVALTTFYSYDDFGRIEWVAYRGFGSGKMTIAYTYDLQNNIIKKTFVDAANTANNCFWWYEYDQAGRLARTFSGSDSLSRVKEAEYTYTASGKVNTLALGATPAQTLAFTYTERDWVSTISSTQFWEHLGYNTISEIGSAVSAPAQYNGNISWMSYYENGNSFNWGPPNPTQTVGYGFTYDKANRLTAAKFGGNYSGWFANNSYTMPFISYDKNGNIDSLARFGTYATIMDRFKYHYLANTNRLDYITDAVAGSAFTTDIDNQPPGNYRYDPNGSMQSDSANAISFVVYDISNLPVTEYKRDGTVIQYAYEANGQRATKLVGTTYTWYFPGADGKTEVLYTNGTTNPTYNLWALDNVGQVKRSGGTLNRYYYLKDHLGDTRMTVTATGAIDSYFDYYPFGQMMDNRVMVTSADGRYKYTGKERDFETGYDYFGARYYDPKIARWLAVDPLAEQNSGPSPYCYASNDGINFFDPDGKASRETSRLLSNDWYVRGRNLFLSTVLGQQQWQRLNDSKDVMVIYDVVDLNPSVDDGVRGNTIWDYRTRTDNPTDYDLGGEHVVFSNMTLIIVRLDPRLIRDGDLAVASVIYHENRAHIEYGLDIGDFEGRDTNKDNWQHNQYGETYFHGPIRRGSDADKFRQEAQRVNRIRRKEQENQRGYRSERHRCYSYDPFGEENHEHPRW